jgi:hypothetical protein
MTPVLRRKPKSYFRRLTGLKKLFWLYFLLLIVEGALRKWVVPQLSAPLLVVRDPVGLLIIWEAYRTRKWPNRWTVAIILLSLLIVGLFTVQVIAGDSLIGELYGLRTYLLPFPVLFIMGENLDAEDLRRMGVATLWLLLPIVAIEVGQYLTPPNSFLNAGAYRGAEQISFISGLSVRASGTFSFVIGAVEYDVLAAAFIFYGMIREGYAKKWLLWAAAFALLLSVPLTGSRGTVIQLAVLLACVALSAAMGVSQFAKTLRIILPLAILIFLATRLPVFSNAMSDLGERFQLETNAGQVEQSAGRSNENFVIFRLFTPMIDTIEDPKFTRSWMGIGMGRGANAVQALPGAPQGGAGETEFQREFREMGPIAGMLFPIFKLLLGIVIFGQALARAREGEPLALLLVPLAVVWLFFAQLEEPTEQGFVVIGAAFCIAAAKLPARVAARVPTLIQRPRPPMYPRRVPRG